MDRFRSSALLLAVLGLGLLLPPLLHAQTPAPSESVSASSPSAQQAATALHTAERAHLWRVAAWGGANALGGLALVWGTSRSQRSARWHFGAMSAGWGLVNVGIATAGLLGSSAPPADLTAVRTAERQFHDILLFNLGLNVAYSAVGATMLGAGYRDVSNAERWRGFGTSLVLQGAGLLVLDGIAFFASRTRLAGLLSQQADLSLHVQPSRVALALQF
jgi:hypothetical protein